MARPIQATPTLYGKDAANFYKMLEENKHKKVSKKTIEEIQKAADFIKSITIR